MLIFGILLFLFMAVVRSVFAACNADSSLPDQYCTPGSVLYGVTKQTLCTPGYSLTVRDVSNTKKKQILKDYGINPADYKCTFGIDHLISLQLGGNNDDTNLWPLPYPIKKEKDKLENYLRRAICRGQITIPEAQEAISKNWQAAYYKYGLGILKKVDLELWGNWEKQYKKER